MHWEVFYVLEAVKLKLFVSANIINCSTVDLVKNPPEKIARKFVLFV